MIEPLLDPLHPAHEEFKKRGLEQLALVNGVNYTDLDQRRCPICQGTGHLGKADRRIERKTQLSRDSASTRRSSLPLPP